jgi:CxxC motif-containing protein (DUF1111 family)
MSSARNKSRITQHRNQLSLKPLALVVSVVLFMLLVSHVEAAQKTSENSPQPPRKARLATDPGPRQGAPGGGQLVSGLNANQKTSANLGLTEFQSVHAVTGTGEMGLGPRFDSNACASCHSNPAIGGSAPASNPLFGVYQLDGAQNTMPTFEIPAGPALTARFPFQSDLVTPDGSVHQLFVVTGRGDASGCSIVQPNFSQAQADHNIAFRQSTPLFGAGMMELILDSDIINNLNSNTVLKQQLGITGAPNYTEDGSIGRLGWKAQDRSVLILAFEMFNVEMGVTNIDLPDELDETPGCLLNPLPEDNTNFGASSPIDYPGDSERIAIYTRMLDQPVPAKPNADTINGQTQFNNIGCVLCHTTSFTTPLSTVGALSNVTANLFSDLLVHHMGPCLADNITQGFASGDEFRTAPLWNVGQRIFFLHDGRTTDIVQAVEDHFCTADAQYPNSEANAVVNAFNALSPTNQQDLIDFLRSL